MQSEALSEDRDTEIQLTDLPHSLKKFNQINQPNSSWPLNLP